VGSPYIRDGVSLRWVDPKAFVANTAGTFGNSGYNALTGPGFFMADASVNRTCRIHERQRIEMRLEFFNVLNHTNMSGPAAITLLP